MLNGKRFGKWTVLSGPYKKNRRKFLECKCDCGMVKLVYYYHLTSGASKQCRRCSDFSGSICLKKGEIYNSWTVLNLAPTKKPGTWYSCECICGTTHNLLGHDLISNRSKQCRKCSSKANPITHGMSYKTTYKIWQAINQRCNNPQNTNYKYYGARGIKVCKRWKDFDNFLSDMGMRPQGLQIDRINNNGDYEQQNCKWTTASENQKNKRASSQYGKLLQVNSASNLAD